MDWARFWTVAVRVAVAYMVFGGVCCLGVAWFNGGPARKAVHGILVTMVVSAVIIGAWCGLGIRVTLGG